MRFGDISTTTAGRFQEAAATQEAVPYRYGTVAFASWTSSLSLRQDFNEIITHSFFFFLFFLHTESMKLWGRRRA